MAKLNIYAACDSIEPTKLDHVVDPTVAEAIGMDFRTLPSFEKNLYRYILKRHYSFKNNDLLRCKWLEYKRNVDKKVFAPFQFLNTRHEHFYVCRAVYRPQETARARDTHGRRMRAGPGVDQRGQVPIPDDLLMKRL